MTSRDFCYWLQGFFEIHNAGPKPGEPFDAKALAGYQVELIERHLSMVFKHEIDPSFGGKEIQIDLDKIHHPKPPAGSMIARC